MLIAHKFELLNNIDQKINIINIKLFFMPHDSVLLVTYDDKVFQYFEDGRLKELKLLSKKNVRKFDSGDAHYIALTEDGHACSWGENEYGQLANGTYDDCPEGPKWILSDKHVIDITCGANHTIILLRSEFNYVYLYGQHGKGNVNKIIGPLIVDFGNIKIKAIACNHNYSIALLDKGIVVGWENNFIRKLSHNNCQELLKLNQLKVPPIKKVTCSENFTILLSKNGDVYLCEVRISNKLVFKIFEFDKEIKFKKIASSIHRDLIVAKSSDSICFIVNTKLNVLEQTNRDSMMDTFAVSAQITYKTIRNKNILSLEEIPALFEPNKYKHSFKYESVIKSGGFSTVFLSYYILHNKCYAIKKIGINQENIKTVAKELKLLNELQSPFVVSLIGTWIEKNYYINHKKSDQRNSLLNKKLLDPEAIYLLHIQMEVCSLTLNDVLVSLMENISCKQTTIELVSLIRYFVASELMVEILECVKDLHKRNPPIIHRDLNPNNILISNFSNNKFVKLSDFGFSTYQVDHSLTANIGSPFYTAPEVYKNILTNKIEDITKVKTLYTKKADIYSLGKIWPELYNFTGETKFTFEPIKEVQRLTYLSLHGNPDLRPECSDMLQCKDSWCLAPEYIKTREEFLRIVNKPSKTLSIKDNFVDFFIVKKFEI